MVVTFVAVDRTYSTEDAIRINTVLGMDFRPDPYYNNQLVPIESTMQLDLTKREFLEVLVLLGEVEVYLGRQGNHTVMMRYEKDVYGLGTMPMDASAEIH